MTAAGARAPAGGQLESTSPVEVLQLLEGKGATARVRFDTRTTYGEVDLVDGVIVDAFMGDLFGRPALMGLLGLTEGHFEISYQPMEPRPPLVTGVQGLLGERARRATRWRELCDKAPPLTSEVSLTPSGRAALTEGAANGPARDVLNLVEAHPLLVDLIEASGLDAVDSLEVILSALQSGWLQAAGQPPKPVPSPVPKKAEPEPFQQSEARPSQGLSGVALRRTTTIGIGIPEAVPVRRIAAHPIVSITDATQSKSNPPPKAEPTPEVVPARNAGRGRKASSGRFVGRYELLCRIGYGGMGSVYLSRLSGEGGFRRLFALKMLRTHLSASGAAAARFLDEARLSAHIHHPNVVPVFDAGLFGDQPYLVMDYVEGSSLRELLAVAPDRRPAHLIVPIIVDALAGLHAAHTIVSDDGTPLELVHCDVSPENLLVGVDGVCRLTDFGVARYGTVDRDGHSTHGKPAYLAPEQVLGHYVDRRADIFAMGAVLYNALTGTRLFESPSVEETLRRVCTESIPPPSTIGLRPSPSFDLVCMRALEREPVRRFATAEEMAIELRRVALRENTFAAPPEVAAWVRAVAGPALSQRRLALLDASRRQLPPSDPPSKAEGAVPGQAAPESVEGGEGSRTIALPELEELGIVPAPPSQRTLLLIIASVLAAVLVLASLVWTRQISRFFEIHTDAVVSERAAGQTPPAPSSSAAGTLPSALPAGQVAPPPASTPR